jgi:hypothetical protein
LQIKKTLLSLHRFQRNTGASRDKRQEWPPITYKGSIAQLVQSICLTSRGSQVRILLLPQKKGWIFIIQPFFYYICRINDTTILRIIMTPLLFKNLRLRIICFFIPIYNGIDFNYAIDMRFSRMTICKMVYSNNLSN